MELPEFKKKTTVEQCSRSEFLLENLEEAAKRGCAITLKDSFQSLGKRLSGVTKSDNASAKRQVGQ